MSTLVRKAFIEELQKSPEHERKAMCDCAMWRWQQFLHDGDISLQEYEEAVAQLRSMNFIARAEEN